MSHKPRKIGNLLRHSNTLEPLRLELDQQSAVTERVRAALAKDASAHLVAARVRGTELVLYVDSPVWATQLRLQGPGLLRALNSRQITARTVRARVVVPAHTRPAGKGASLPESARSALTEAAKGTRDDALKASLLRLSRRCR